MLGVLSSKTVFCLEYSPHPNSLSPFYIMAVKWPVVPVVSDPFPCTKAQLLISLYHASVTTVPEV